MAPSSSWSRRRRPAIGVRLGSPRKTGRNGPFNFLRRQGRLDDARWLMLIGLITAMAMVTAPAMGRDLDGRHKNSPLHDWFEHLASGEDLYAGASRCQADARSSAGDERGFSIKHVVLLLLLGLRRAAASRTAPPKKSGKSRATPAYLLAVSAWLILSWLRCFISSWSGTVNASITACPGKTLWSASTNEIFTVCWPAGSPATAEHRGM